MNVKLVDVVPTHELIWRNCLLDGQVIACPAVKPKTKTQQMRLRGILHVTVHTAVNLNLGGYTGSQVFVELECGKEKLHTTPSKESEGGEGISDPVWDEVFPIPFDIEADTAPDDNSDLLTLTVKNQKLLTHTSCGRVTVLLKDLASVYYKRRLPPIGKGEVPGDWFQLSKDAGWKVGGFIRLSFIFEALGAEGVAKVLAAVSESDWVEDKKIEKCPLCSDAFLVFNRRHHCRKCGAVICDKCSQYRMILEPGQAKQRVCDKCNPNKNGIHLEILDDVAGSALPCVCKCGEPFNKLDEMFCSRCGTARPEAGKKVKKDKEKKSRIGSVFSGSGSSSKRDKSGDDGALAEREAKLVQQEEQLQERLKELEAKQNALEMQTAKMKEAGGGTREEIVQLERKLNLQEKEEAKKIKALDSQLRAAELAHQDALVKCDDLQTSLNKLRADRNNSSASDLSRIQSKDCLSEGESNNSEAIQELESQLHTMRLEIEQITREKDRLLSNQKQESLLLQQTLEDMRFRLSTVSAERDQVQKQRQQLAALLEQKSFEGSDGASLLVEQAIQDMKRQLEATLAERDALSTRLISMTKRHNEDRQHYETQLDDFKMKCQRAEARAVDLERGARNAPAIDSGMIGAEIARAVTAAIQASGPAKTFGKCLRCGKTYTARNVTKFCCYHPGRYDWTGEKQYALGKYVCCKGGQKSSGCKKEPAHNFE